MGTATSRLPQPVIFEQFTNVLAALADRAPLLLILDDMQWADRGTTSLLFHLAPRPQGQPRFSLPFTALVISSPRKPKTGSRWS